MNVQGVNLSTGGMGLDGMKEPLRLAGLLDVSFVLPESKTQFQAKARLMWVGDEGRVGIRFIVIEPALFEELQHWTNQENEGRRLGVPGLKILARRAFGAILCAITFILDTARHPNQNVSNSPGAGVQFCASPNFP